MGHIEIIKPKWYHSILRFIRILFKPVIILDRKIENIVGFKLPTL